MVDWSLAATVGKAVAGAPSGVPALPPVDEPARVSERLVAQYTGLHPADPVPLPEAVDRATWVDAVVRSMRGTVEPLAAGMSKGLKGPLGAPLNAVAGVAMAAQVGAVSGLLAQRVLGQYDLALLDPTQAPRLLFVAPNIAQAARRWEADPDSVLQWVALHEITHAVQFGAVPWLRDHLAGKLRALLDGLQPAAKPDFPALLRGDLPGFLLGPAKKELLADVQAAMSVIEGYAEHVMDAVGEDVLPDLPQLRAKMDERRDARKSVVWLVLEKLLGLDMKLRQYKQGKAFCDAVVTEGGIEALNRVWDSPASLPTLEELEAPRTWTARVAA